MFWSQLRSLRLKAMAMAAGFVVATVPGAWAQTPSENPASVTLHSATVYPAQPAAQAKTDAMLAALSAEAGIPFFRSSNPAAAQTASSDGVSPPEPPLCVRAGVGLSVPMMAGPPMTVEHGLIGCPTSTGGLPVIVTQDPTVQLPPSSRTGEYNLDVTVRYRVLRLRHVQLVASLVEQGVGYSIDSPVSGNNVLVAMSLIF